MVKDELAEIERLLNKWGYRCLGSGDIKWLVEEVKSLREDLAAANRLIDSLNADLAKSK